MPHIDAVVDRMTVATELGRTETITVTVASMGGFAGDVAIAPTIADPAGTSLTNGITVSGPATVTVAANGTAKAAYTVTIPTNASGADLTATAGFAVTSSIGDKQLTSALTVAAVYTMTYPAGLGSDTANHPGSGKKISVKKGTKIRYHNADTISHISHGGGAFQPQHESTNVDTGGLPDKTYEFTTADLKVGDSGALGCHSHDSKTYGTFTVE
jgi:hypothetical protein